MQRGPYLSTTALGQSQALDLSLQGAQLLPDSSFPSIQRLLHLFLTIKVILKALLLHLTDLCVAVILQIGQTALEAIQDVRSHSSQLDVEDLVQRSAGA